MSNLKWLIVSVCLILCSQQLGAQGASARLMGINELFRLADENSKSIQVFNTGKEAAEEAWKAAKTNRLPDIKVSASGSYIGNGYLWNRHYKDGMNVTMPHWGNNFAIEAQQVIYSGGALSGNIALTELGKRMAELDGQKNRQEIRFMLLGYYLDLYKLSNQKTVLLKNLELTDKVIRNMETRRSQGTALRNDITRYELQKEMLRLQLSQVEDASTILNHQLVTTLHLPQKTIIQPDSLLPHAEVKTLTEKDWQQMALQSNLNLQQAELTVKMNEQKVKLEKSELLPKIILVAEDHLDGPILVEVPTINKNFNYWFVGIGVQYNLSSLFKNNRKVSQAKLNGRQGIEQKELIAEHTENAVQAGYVNYLTSFVDLRTQEKSVELANQNYDVTSNRYKNDLALLTDMLDASNMKLSADLNLLNARINVIYNYYKMKYISHTL